MDATANFFSKLRNLAVTLEKESKHLEQALNNEPGHEEEAPMKILHELHSEVRNIKVDLNKKLHTLNLERKQNREFIRACQILHQRFSGDLEKIEDHFQKYGYEPLQRKEEPPNGLTNGETENCEVEEEKSDEVSTPPPEKPSLNDHLRTPRMEDFGIGHLMFQTAWKLPQCMQTPGQKVTDKDHMKGQDWITTLPKTPKCALYLDDEFLSTPKMEDFGITEHTACVNDFTMQLYNKSAQQKLDRCLPIPAAQADEEQTVQKRTAESAADAFMKQQKVLNTVELLSSPLPPIFCTPGLKIHKKQIPVSSHTPEDTERSNDLLPSPVVPNFETPWLKRKLAQLHLKDGKTAAPAEKTGSDQFSSEEPQPPIIKSPLSPKMTDYEHLVNTPQAPEFKMSDDVLKILSSYNINCMTPHDMHTRNMKS